MKPEELMIGDWVEVPFLEGKPKIVKVEEILSDEINPEWDGMENYGGIKIKYVKPIPLTPEILEKNGFEKIKIDGEEQDKIFQCFYDEIIIEVGIYDPNFILIHYCYETPDGINSGEISSVVKVDGGKFYLHELQHALKLCGIEKTIEL